MVSTLNGVNEPLPAILLRRVSVTEMIFQNACCIGLAFAQHEKFSQQQELVRMLKIYHGSICTSFLLV